MGEIVIQIYIIGFLFYCLCGLLPHNFNIKREKVIELQGSKNNNSNTDMVTVISIIIDSILWPITILALLFLSKKR